VLKKNKITHMLVKPEIDTIPDCQKEKK